MVRKAKTALLVTGIIIAVIVAGVITVKYYAIHVAREYIVQTFEQEMQYKDIWFWWDEPPYHFRFFPVDNPEIVFEVAVSYNFSVREYNYSLQNRKKTSSNNYYTMRFQLLMPEFNAPQQTNQVAHD